ncbi:ABC transporter substrate-binding protein [Spirabiliibacterium falconis]|uniref:ABC transporter substrate-binding protein n=1 Tax=Spirabiliibacterium falconis TaxID=572023 RepID=UPI001AAD4B4F|nr:ABC transporter substrate-binding protein [Spirabiliibacterium falconis]MBE2894993.1 ABC transporter substrate-binding protein [Spirabiliibacterium falconis]
MKKVILVLSGLLFGLLAYTNTASAAGRLVVYCSATNAMCDSEAKAFGAKYDVKISIARYSTGSALAKIEAEKNNPQADVWYGGTLEPHLLAANMGLTQPYKSPNFAEIDPRFIHTQKMKEHYLSPIYMLVLGFGVNTERLARLQAKAPQCWADLTKREYQHEIQLPDPQSSGTAYSLLATLVQIMGEDNAFAFLKELNNNIGQYNKSGTIASRNVGRGDSALGVGFLHGYTQEKEKGAPVELIIPCEGTGYTLGAVSILKGARNLDNAKLFVDWALSKESQELMWKEGEFNQIITNRNAQQAPTALKLDELKLIEFDFEQYGEPTVSKHLIKRWTDEIKLGK